MLFLRIYKHFGSHWGAVCNCCHRDDCGARESKSRSHDNFGYYWGALSVTAAILIADMFGFALSVTAAND